MPVSTTEVGIQQIDDFALLQESEVEVALSELEPCLLYTGKLNDDASEGFDPIKTFNFKGKGDLPAGLALATDGGFTHELITGGVTLILNVKETESGDQNNTWECSGENAPNADALA